MRGLRAIVAPSHVSSGRVDANGPTYGASIDRSGENVVAVPANVHEILTLIIGMPSGDLTDREERLRA